MKSKKDQQPRSNILVTLVDVFADQIGLLNLEWCKIY